MSDYVSLFTISNTINGFSDKSSGGRKLRWHPFLTFSFYYIIDFITYFLFFCILLANILSACEKAG